MLNSLFCLVIVFTVVASRTRHQLKLPVYIYMYTYFFMDNRIEPLNVCMNLIFSSNLVIENHFVFIYDFFLLKISILSIRGTKYIALNCMCGNNLKRAIEWNAIQSPPIGESCKHY